MNLAEKVRNKRIELGLSQDELAKRMGYTSRSSVNKIEKGREISPKIVHKLAEALDVSFSYLMGIEEKPAEKSGVEVLGTMQTVKTDIKADFCLYMSDQSMGDAGILKNDLIFFVKRSRYRHKTIVCIEQDGDHLVRLFCQYENIWVFRSADRHEQEIVCEKNGIAILGEACALERKLN